MQLPKQRDLSSWLKTDQMIEQWLMQRQALLVMYNQIGLSKTQPHRDFKPKFLDSFCQVLMDYLSAGHFKIFEQLEAAYQSCNAQSLAINKKLLDNILHTTHVALNFNDKYTNPLHFKELPLDLSLLGENLAHRMEWEDSLLKAYLQITRH